MNSLEDLEKKINSKSTFAHLRIFFSNVLVVAGAVPYFGDRRAAFLLLLLLLLLRLHVDALAPGLAPLLPRALVLG